MSLTEGGADSPHARSSFEIKKSLMRRAFDQGRGPEMIQEILKRVHRARDAAAEHAEQLAEARLMADEPRSVRMLNLIAEHEGSKTRYTSHGTPNGPSMH